MSAQLARVAHSGKSPTQSHQEPHAALLIDFDNVTMGIRSDITKELKNLLNSDIIKGKVSVQRAYADWRRYPQYVVPLAETSVDLIFAPAYGSSKKNATDIRLAIDALELVFTRPEIGTYILLSGDSDFSSLVLKLKEYGKYVVGVGIRESASDLLVQNCDEYYSYSALTGLKRAGDEEPLVTPDPWELVDIAVRQMVEAGDVMRSDRLKQVLLELNPNFDEKDLGFSKFNRFVSEAANRGLLRLQKMENGQFEIALAEEDGDAPAAAKKQRGGAAQRPEPRAKEQPEKEAPPQPERPPRGEARAERMDGLPGAFDLLRRAARELGGDADKAVRDSDVKRRMLDLDPEWDESSLGFSKFSRFLRQAHDAEVINLRKIDNGNYELTLPDGGPAAVEQPDAGERSKDAADTRNGTGTADDEEGRRSRRGRRGRRGEGRGRKAETAKSPEPKAAAEAEKKADRAAPAAPREAGAAAAPPAKAEATVAKQGGSVIGLRRGSKGPRPSGPPPLLEGQVVARQGAASATPATGAAAAVAPTDLGLPVKPEAVIDYLTKAYKGIGRKSAANLVEAVGAANVFTTLEADPDRIRAVLGDKRGDTLLDAWAEDYARRSGRARNASAPATNASPATDSSGQRKQRRPRGRRGGRKRSAKADKSGATSS